MLELESDHLSGVFSDRQLLWSKSATFCVPNKIWAGRLLQVLCWKPWNESDADPQVRLPLGVPAAAGRAVMKRPAAQPALDFDKASQVVEQGGDAEPLHDDADEERRAEHVDKKVKLSDLRIDVPSTGPLHGDHGQEGSQGSRSWTTRPRCCTWRGSWAPGVRG